MQTILSRLSQRQSMRLPQLNKLQLSLIKFLFNNGVAVIMLAFVCVCVYQVLLFELENRRNEIMQNNQIERLHEKNQRLQNHVHLIDSLRVLHLNDD